MDYRKGTPEDTFLLLTIWEKSVLMTHDFLAKEDRESLYLEIPHYFPHLEIQIWQDKEQIIGFSACSNAHLEMLFLDPEFIGKGYGKQILSQLIDEFAIRFVDVNEQNQKAKDFYLKNGFKIVNRQPLDNQGRPYPILELALTDD